MPISLVPPISKESPFQPLIRVRWDQPRNLLAIISLTKLNMHFFPLPTKDGRPGYLHMVNTIQHTQDSVQVVLRFDGVFMLQKTPDFCRLIAWPDASLYICSIYLTRKLSFVLALKKKKESPMNSKWEVLGLRGQTFTPSPCAFSFWNSADISSTHKMNKYSDKGSPCRRSRWDWPQFLSH